MTRTARRDTGPCAQTLEPRLLLAGGPVAVLAATDVTTPGGAYLDITVTYTDPDGVDASTFDAGDIVVSGPDLTASNVTLIGATVPGNGSPRSVVYRIAAPGGSWDFFDNATYALWQAPDAVKDLSGNAADAVKIGQFVVDVPDTSPPLAALSPLDVVRPKTGATTLTFQVLYVENMALDTATLGDGDVRVRGPGSFDAAARLVAVGAPSVLPASGGSDNANRQQRLVTYVFDAPGGAWNYADNGTYTVSIADSQVADTVGNYAAAADIGSFTVDIDVADLTATLRTWTLPAVIVPGDTGRAIVLVRNAGDLAAAGNVKVEIYGVCGSQTFTVGGLTVPLRLAVGGTALVNISLAIGPDAPAGDWTFWGAVDTTGAVPEAREDNNTITIANTAACVWRFGTFGPRRGAALTLLYAGKTMTFRMSGAGYGELAVSGGLPELTMVGATTASSVTITTPAGTTATLGSVSAASGLAALNASSVVVNGSFTTGPVGRIALAGFAGRAIVAGSVTTMSLGRVSDSSITVTGAVGAFIAVDWLDTGGDDDLLEAWRIERLSVTGARGVAGSFQADLSLAGVPGLPRTLGSATIACDVSGSDWLVLGNTGPVYVGRWLESASWRMRGDVTSLSAGGMNGATVFVGVREGLTVLPARTDDFDLLARLSAVVVRGVYVGRTQAESFLGSNVAAPSIGTVSLLGLRPAVVRGTAFGFAARAIGAWPVRYAVAAGASPAFCVLLPSGTDLVASNIWRR